MTTSAKPRSRAPKRRDQAFFGLHFDLHPSDADTQLGRFVTPAMVRRIIRAARPDFIQYDCKGHVGFLGYPDSRVSTVAGGPGGKGMIRDSLAIYRQVTRAAGVGLFVHFSGVWDNQALKDHPEWAAIKADGTPEPNATSTFSPYVLERMIPQMCEIIDRYGVDGFWVDGDCWATMPDYCPAARARFKELTGQDTPPTKPGEEFWYEWMTLQRQQFQAYLREYIDAVHAHSTGTRPGGRVQVASNWLYSPHSPEPVSQPVDFISGDYSHSDSINSARFTARYLSNVGLPWDLAAWAFSVPHHGAHVYKPAEQLMQEAGLVLALGGAFQMYFSPDRHGGFPDWQVRLMGQVADFCHQRKEFCFQSRPFEQVALLLDSHTFFRISPRVYAPYDGEYEGLNGMLHAMLESGYSVDVLADHQQPWKDDRWPVIVVPEFRAVAPETVAGLAAYARRGGSVLLVGAETCGLFREHLGVEFVGAPEKVEAHIQHGVDGPLAPASGKPATKHSWACPASGLWQDVRVQPSRARSAKVLAHRSPDRACLLGTKPAATLTAVGRGHIAAVYGPLGISHSRHHTPGLRDLVDAILGRLYRPYARLDARQIDVAVRRLDGRVVVHLNNLAEFPRSNFSYPVLERVPPTGPVTLRLALPKSAKRPKKIWLQPEGRRLTARATAEGLAFKVPPIHIHSAIVIE